MDILEVVW